MKIECIYKVIYSKKTRTESVTGNILDKTHGTLLLNNYFKRKYPQRKIEILTINKL